MLVELPISLELLAPLLNPAEEPPPLVTPDELPCAPLVVAREEEPTWPLLVPPLAPPVLLLDDEELELLPLLPASLPVSVVGQAQCMRLPQNRAIQKC
jgi:hypothetical protein